ncbi:MAG: preprotein translocase subunit SecE [Candidatus Paceibacterota bacterium]
MEKKGFWESLKAYFSDVKAEVKKVTWPTRSEIIKDTVVVLVFAFAFAAVLGGLDALFRFAIQKFIIH